VEFTLASRNAVSSSPSSRTAVRMALPFSFAGASSRRCLGSTPDQEAQARLLRQPEIRVATVATRHNVEEPASTDHPGGRCSWQVSKAILARGHDFSEYEQ
jgi:hypothetical protein